MQAAKPFLKWAGGKSRLLGALLAHVPPHVETYVEPFAGGAALFFALAAERRFRRALLTDVNAELVACYRAVRDDVEGLVEALSAYRYDADLFYAERKRDTKSLDDVTRGARFIFLNRTCFNGLWRVNAKGQFNVPFGRYKKPRIQDPEGLRAASRALRGVRIEEVDFAAAVSGLGRGDFVYFDPPYVPVSATADFTGYAAGGFGHKDQERLARVMKSLGRRGVTAVLSNADTAAARELYAGLPFEQVRMPRAINSDPKKRGDAAELLVYTEAPRFTAPVRARRTAG